jgi:DNA mismatch repair ATPase MutS
LRAPIAGDQQRPSAAGALDRLERILGFASVRHTPILHWPLQALTLWDFHVWWTLEGWQRRHGRHVRGWMDAIAEVEALSALAGLAHDHPAWAWPVVSPDEDRLTATGLTHPLLAPERAVGNDIGVGPPGRVLLVTGSNMSGKSTLLRAIGLNAVLAQMGAPVAARRLRMPPLAVVTSMRLQDSLEDGVSFFMASLARLRLVVDRARLASADPSQPMALYLLDELLGGTNTAEREVAVRGVVRHLVACRAIGALTSHDLALAEAPELRAHGECVHFRESLGAGADAGAAMTFDYRLRPGVATSRNALALMRAVGLGDLV